MISVIFACVFACLFAGSTALLIRSTKNSLQMIDKLDELEEQLEISLKILEEKHKRLEAKSKTEIFFDDPVVQDLVKDIASCRDAIFAIIKNFDNKEEN